ncbi:MAG TPA: hypothetical protein VFR05_11405, partial [Terriglobia bacterium]|nr:hypothetical protein [Terriglobia bacterium]
SSSNGWLIVALLILLAGLLAASLKDGLQLLPELLAVGFLILSSTASQALVYAKSGVFERYLIPGTLLLAFLVVYLIARIERMVKPDRARLVVSILLLLAVLLSLGMKFEGAWMTARAYTEEGTMLHQALEKIGTSTANSDVVLLAADPALDYEPIFATSEYLRTLVDRKNIVIYPIWAKPEETYTEFFRTLGSSFEKGLGNQHYEAMADKSQIKAILTFTFNQTDKALRENWPRALDSSRFQRHEFGQFTVYTASR